MDRFFADIDAARDFRGLGSVFGAALSVATGEGFAALMAANDAQGEHFASPLAFRSRFLMQMMRARSDGS